MKSFRADEMGAIIDNIGLPYSGINTSHATTGVIGAADADIMVSLKEDHRPTDGYVQKIRLALARDFPGVTFYILPADMITQILNFGLPSPIDIQIGGADIDANRAVANQILSEMRQCPASSMLRIQQPFDYPELRRHGRPDQGAAERADRTRRRAAACSTR